jgi:hypothetical protein
VHRHNIGPGERGVGLGPLSRTRFQFFAFTYVFGCKNENRGRGRAFSEEKLKNALKKLRKNVKLWSFFDRVENKNAKKCKNAQTVEI